MADNFAMGLTPPSVAQDLGFGGADLAKRVQDETEEERKKRLARQQAMASMGPAARALGSGFAGFGGANMGIGQL